MPDAQPKENLSLVRPMSAEEIIFIQLKDLKDEFRESRKELADKIDKLSDKIDSSTKHGQILAGSCSAITIAVLLSIFLK